MNPEFWSDTESWPETGRHRQSANSLPVVVAIVKHNTQSGLFADAVIPAGMPNTELVQSMAFEFL